MSASDKQELGTDTVSDNRLGKLSDHDSSATQARFLFVGNGPYRNRGCEAIVRGTMEILSGIWPDVSAQAGVMAAPGTVAAQQTAETDPRVTNFSVSHVGKRLTRKWWLAQANKRLGTSFQHHTLDLEGHFSGVRAAMQLGGDNYSLDYGQPWDYIAVDRYLQKHGIPVFLWGASVGPFDSDPEFAPVIHAHLKTLDGIFVRETRTQAYLASHGIEKNVHLVADPAFVMVPAVPKDAAVRSLVSDQTIGINISPLVARFSSADGVEEWRAKSAEMIIACARRTGCPILLIPHVASPLPQEDDYAFLANLRDMTEREAGVPVNIAPALGAAELKWLIGQCRAFAGARTHSTIAAMSSGVPTLSLSYSVKAIGINQDVFGHQEYCQSVKTITPAQFADIMGRMIDDNEAIRADLAARLPAIRERARSAGHILENLTRAH